jgi:hypothetical protein
VTPVSQAVQGILQRCGPIPCNCGDQEDSGVLRRAALESARQRGGVPPIVYNVLNGPGQPLAADTRAFFEPRFGHDFSRVRVHTGSSAAASADAVNARAYTVGHNVVFASGVYAPHTVTGRRFLAHELVHVIQQRGVGSNAADHTLRLGDRNSPAEHEAHAGAVRATDEPMPANATPAAGVSATIQRDGSGTGDSATARAEDCRTSVGSCDFYRCRQRLAGSRHPASAYYQGYGLKYCERFSTVTRPKLSRTGQLWLDKTLFCLQKFLYDHVPVDASPEVVKTMAFNSHPGCYVTSGLCFLSPEDWAVIWATIDSRDNDLKQILVTAVYCAGNYLPMMFPTLSLAAGGGYRGLMERDRRRAYGGAEGVRPFPPPGARHDQ